MPDRNIAYIADPEHMAPAVLNEYWAPLGVRMVPYVASPSDTALPTECLLFAPYYSNGLYLSVEAVWKKHFEKKSPQSKLVIVGTAPGQGQNYCDLLFLPADPGYLFREAKTAGENWTPVSSGGVDMVEKLRRFIDGHGRTGDPDQSVMESFGKVPKDLELFREGCPPDMSATEVWNRIFKKVAARQFNAFIARWERYKPYFDALPLSSVFAEIEKQSKLLDTYFKNRPSDDENEITAWIAGALTPANVVYQHLTTVDGYVRSYQTL